MTSTPWSTIRGGRPDIRLVVTDMDGTLLDESGRIPDRFWPLLALMRTQGITFVPASGRQYATLLGQFKGAHRFVSYIAENGNLVVHEGNVVSITHVEDATVDDVITTTRNAASRADLGVVVCGIDSAYIERTDPAFVAEAETYYTKLTIVDDLTSVSDTILKLAIFDFDEAAHTANETYAHLADTHQVVVSGKHWIDIMSTGVDKGRGVTALQAVLGVSPAQTVVFGDYLNDLQMLDCAEWSFAVSNAHPEIRDRARYLAPSNAEHGVVQVLERLLAASEGLN